MADYTGTIEKEDEIELEHENFLTIDFLLTRKSYNTYMENRGTEKEGGNKRVWKRWYVNKGYNSNRVRLQL